MSLSAITTVEGVLERTVAGLEQDQPLRKALDPENAAKIEEYIERIQGLMGLNEPFTVVRIEHFQMIYSFSY